MNDRVIIFDTTLRDGEQALQASLSLHDKVQIALALERLGVDVMEAGFPVSSPGDFESVREIAKRVRSSRVCALARCVDRDIETAAEALAPAEAARLHVFLATSTLHLDAKLRRSFDQMLEMATRAIGLARNFTDDVEFSCEDAGRTPIDDLCRVVEKAIQAGARTINIPDTVGYTLPGQFGEIISTLRNRVPNIDKAVLSVHCHDDLGMAVGNSIAAIEAGARQVEGTLNGIGERAGNCALEEVIMAIQVRADRLGVRTGIDCTELHRASRTVSQICNMPVPANKAIVGANAFSHSSGIHQDGVLKNRATYEIMSPESIGLKNVKLNLTSRSGRAAIKNAMQEMGYDSAQYDLETLYAAFLKLADRKGQVFDYDLEALAFIGARSADVAHFSMTEFDYRSSSEGKSSAQVFLRCGEKETHVVAEGNGPIDAMFRAIGSAATFPATLVSCVMNAKGCGRDALGQVDVVLDHEGRPFHGVGLATDTVEAAALALIDGLKHIQRALLVTAARPKPLQAQAQTQT